MTIFSQQPLKKRFFFVKVTPPPPEESECKNAQWILKDDDVYFKNHSIFNLREFVQSEKYRVFTQHAAVAILRHSATID